jgi:hypothetical protein
MPVSCALLVRLASDSVASPGDPVLLSAVRTAEDAARSLDAMANHPASAMSASRCQGLNSAFKTIEGMGRAAQHYVEGFVVIIPACFANGHGFAPPSARLRII